MTATNKRSELRRIARRCMLERGLLPDFSSDALAETAALTDAPRDDGAAIRDLRTLLWCSIDNDDSRDLDQLTVAEPVADGVVKILVAIADVDAVVGGRRSTTCPRTRPPSTRPPNLSDAPEALSAT
jgi:exoribonuclease-2